MGPFYVYGLISPTWMHYFTVKVLYTYIYIRLGRIGEIYAICILILAQNVWGLGRKYGFCVLEAMKMLMERKLKYAL